MFLHYSINLDHRIDRHASFINLRKKNTLENPEITGIFEPYKSKLD